MTVPGRRLPRLPARSEGSDEHPAAHRKPLAGAWLGRDQVTGIDPLIVEPCPGCDSQRTVPPMAPRRSAMLTKPCPDRALSALKPGPLSLTENSRPPDSSQIRTCALAFGACLAAFCRASRQQK